MDRRQLLTLGAGVLSGLAGCNSASGDSDETTTTTTTTAAEDTTTTGDTTTTTESGSYSVSMEPVGEVTFESVPENWATYFPGYADMAVALGHGDGLNSVGAKSRYHTGYYEDLEGVSMDKSELTELYDGGVGKEIFYALDSEFHLIDPNWLLNNFKGWKRSDVEELVENLGPFLGNVIFRRTDPWHDYRYYTMYEAFEKVAAVFQATERYSQFKAFHDDYIGRITDRLPPESERPNAVLLWQAKDEPESFYPYRISPPSADGYGTNKKQFHDLGVMDALAGTGQKGLSTDDRGQVDYEALLEVDPDSVLLRGHEGKTRAEFENTVLAYMREHSVASSLTAVQNGAVFRGGPIYEGPIQNLFLTERFAKLYYPDTFTESRLFDRASVASIVTG